jgi:hypothetical protein
LPPAAPIDRSSLPCTQFARYPRFVQDVFITLIAESKPAPFPKRRVRHPEKQSLRLCGGKRSPTRLRKILCHNLAVLVHETHELGIDPVFWQNAAEMRYVSILALLSFLISASHDPPPSQKQQQQSTTSPHPPKTDQRGTEKTPLVVKINSPTKTQEEAAHEAEDRNEKSANDRKLVDFTGYLVIATAVLAAIGFLQLIVFGIQSYYLRRTVIAATDQSEAMERSIKEANRLASAMEKAIVPIALSAESAEKSIRLQEAALRQWIETDNWKSEKAQVLANRNVSLMITFEIANRTKMPMTLKTVYMSANGEALSSGILYLLAPNKTYPIKLPIMLRGDKAEAWRQDKLTFAITGSVAYTDAFDSLREDHFGCMCLCGLSGTVFSAYPGILSEKGRTTE